MKIALLVLLGLVLGAMGGAALGMGVGLAWVEIFNVSNFEGYGGMLVFSASCPEGPSWADWPAPSPLASWPCATGKSPSNGPAAPLARNRYPLYQSIVRCKNIALHIEPFGLSHDQ